MKIQTREDYKKLITYLKEISAGQSFIDFSKKTIKTQREIIGVRTSDLRKIAKQIYKNGYVYFFEFGDMFYYEEVFLKALIASHEKDFNKAKELFSKVFKYVDNWAIIDMVVSRLSFVKYEDEGVVFDYFKSLLYGEEFAVRFGIVGLMKYFLKTEKDVEKVLEVLKNINYGRYYVDMAIAWLISEVLIKFPQKAINNMQKIIKNSHFNAFIINKGIQKACESYRLGKDIKEQLKGLKLK